MRKESLLGKSNIVMTVQFDKKRVTMNFTIYLEKKYRVYKADINTEIEYGSAGLPSIHQVL